MAFACNKIGAAFLTLLPLLSACGGAGQPAPTSWYATNNIYAYMRAVQDESGSVVTTVQLRDGPSTSAKYLYLASDETLYSSLNTSVQQHLNFNGNLFGNSQTLAQNLRVMTARDLYTDHLLFGSTVWGTPEYFSSDTPVVSANPVRVYVEFERGGHALTGESVVDLPPAFQILSPTKNVTLSRVNPVLITWTNVDPLTTIELDVAGVCVDGSRYQLHHLLGADTGTVTLNAAQYFSASGPSPATECHVALMLQRIKNGSVSSRFAFGSFTGAQQRGVQFVSTP